MVGVLSDLLLGKEPPVTYKDLGNPIVTLKISRHSFPSTFVDLGAAINIITTRAYKKLGISALEPTSTLLELANRSLIRREGIVQDILVSIDSWEYPTNFVVNNPKNKMDGHPLIFGRPWLATADAYIGCQIGNMTITRGDSIENIIIYPPTKLSLPKIKIHKHPCTYWEQNIRPPLTLVEALDFKDQT